MTTPAVHIPWLPEGRTFMLPGRGKVFARVHRHPDPSAPWLLLLHGWTASADLQFFTAFEAIAARWSFVAIDAPNAASSNQTFCMARRNRFSWFGAAPTDR